jgi:hypothetical protein
MANLRGPDRKSVGKPDAGNRHVRFDERGRETGLLAPRPSSTLPDSAGCQPARRMTSCPTTITSKNVWPALLQGY